MKKGVIFSFLFLLMSFLLFASVENSTCLDCHADKESAVKELDNGKTISVYVNPEVFKHSVHGDLSCTDCHTDLENLTEDDFPHEENLKKVDCGNCHDDVVSDFKHSAHFKAFEKGNKFAPTCVSCHGKHDILPSDDKKSPINKANVVNLCSSCHNGKNLSNVKGLNYPDVLTAYKKSEHYYQITHGNLNAATCVDCHGAHTVMGGENTESKVSKKNVVDTCGTCHQKESEEFKKGIHYKALEAGISVAPTCTDCHNNHEILGKHSKNSVVSSGVVEYLTCMKCHGNQRLGKQFGEEFTSPVTYRSSYHGMSQFNKTDVAARCTDCHNKHDILPMDDPNSSINKKNIVNTCGKCHKGANQTFAMSYTHSTRNYHKNKIAGILKDIYVILIILVIGGMAIHNLIIFFFYLVMKYKKEKEEELIPRFTMQEVIQHVLLAVSFTLLAITGFMLKFSHSFWVQFLVNNLGITESIRATIHRICGATLIIAGIWHIIYLATSKNARKQLKDIIFTFSDITGAIQNVMYHLGLRKEKPLFGKFDYTEKMEYWSLIWGTIVMAVTGLTLWFPVYFSKFMPVWWVRVSEIVHLYEATLATLAILVWHFFFVIFHPEEYPMNFAWLTGRVPAHLAREKYTLWAEEVLEEKKDSQKSEKDEKGEEA